MPLPPSPAPPPSHWLPECHDGPCQGDRSTSKGETQVTSWLSGTSPRSFTGSGTQWTVSKQISGNRRDYSPDTHQVIAGVCSFGAMRLAVLSADSQNTGSIQLMGPFIIIVITVLFVPGSGQDLAAWWQTLQGCRGFWGHRACLQLGSISISLFLWPLQVRVVTFISGSAQKSGCQ